MFSQNSLFRFFSFILTKLTRPFALFSLHSSSESSSRKLNFHVDQLSLCCANLFPWYCVYTVHVHIYPDFYTLQRLSLCHLNYCQFFSSQLELFQLEFAAFAAADADVIRFYFVFDCIRKNNLVHISWELSQLTKLRHFKVLFVTHQRDKVGIFAITLIYPLEFNGRLINRVDIMLYFSFIAFSVVVGAVKWQMCLHSMVRMVVTSHDLFVCLFVCWFDY